MDESIEAKRRRIARVGNLRLARSDAVEKGADLYRPVTCVGKRRSSAMERCRLVPIASTIRQNVFSHRWRKRGTLPKGMDQITYCGHN